VNRGCERCARTNVAVYVMFIWRGPGGQWTVCIECRDYLRAYMVAVNERRLERFLEAQPKRPRHYL